MKSFLLLSILFYAFSGNTQITARNLSLTLTDTAILYLHSENQLKFEGIDTSIDYSVYSRNGCDVHFNRKNSCVYISSCGKPHSIEKLTLVAEQDTIWTQEFQIKLRINKTLCLAGEVHQKISINAIQKNPIINFCPATTEDLYVENRQIRGFDLLITTDELDTIRFFKREESNWYKEDSFSVEDVDLANKLSSEQLELIAKLKPGSKLIFTGVYFVTADGIGRVVGPFEFVLQE